MEIEKKISYSNLSTFLSSMVQKLYTKILHTNKILIKDTVLLSDEGLVLNKINDTLKKDIKKSLKLSEIFEAYTSDGNELSDAFIFDNGVLYFKIDSEGIYSIEIEDKNIIVKENAIKINNVFYINLVRFIQKTYDLSEETNFVVNIKEYTDTTKSYIGPIESKLNNLEVEKLTIGGAPVSSNNVGIEFVEKELPINNMDDKTIYVQKKKKFDTIEGFLKTDFFDNNSNSVADGYSASIDNQSINNILTGEQTKVIYDQAGKQYYIKNNEAYNINDSSETMSVVESGKNIIATLNEDEYKNSLSEDNLPFDENKEDTVTYSNGVTITRSKDFKSFSIKNIIEEAIKEDIKEDIKENNGGNIHRTVNGRTDEWGSKIEDCSYEIVYENKNKNNSIEGLELNYSGNSYTYNITNFDNCTVEVDYNNNDIILTIYDSYIYTVKKTYESKDISKKYLFYIENKNILKDNEYLVNGNNDYPNGTNVVLGKDSVYIGNIKLV